MVCNGEIYSKLPRNAPITNTSKNGMDFEYTSKMFLCGWNNWDCSKLERTGKGGNSGGGVVCCVSGVDAEDDDGENNAVRCLADIQCETGWSINGRT